MAKQQSERDEIVEAFYYFDSDFDGYLTSEELRHVLLGIGKMPEDEVEELLAEADPHNSGKINYQEFADHLWAVIQQFGK